MPTEPSAQPTVAAPPTAPSRGDAPTTFRTLSDAYLAWLALFYAYLVSLATWLFTTAGQVFTNATEAAQSASDAADDASATSDDAIEVADLKAQVEFLHAAVVASSGIDVSAYAIGDYLQVVDDGLGGKELAMSGQRRESTGTITGTTPEFNQDEGIVVDWTLTGNATPTDGLAEGESLVVYIDDGTGYSVTWPTGEWTNNGGEAPTLKPTGETCVVLNKKGGALKLTVVEAG